VEVMVPIKNAQLRAYLKDSVLDAYLKDNVNARELRSDGKYERVKPLEGQKRLDRQLELENAGFNSVRL
jgi:polyphosphate kinase